MNAIKLMNRQDTKYAFHESKLTAILADPPSHYKILEIEGHKIASYENIYFDDDNHLFFQMHQRGKLNRTKIRIRKYVESNLSFIEIKKKTNQARTVKTRIALEANENHESPRIQEFVAKNSPYQLKDLPKQLAISFQRITLAHKDFEDRCTLDFNLKASLDGISYQFNDLVIAELKQEKFRHASAFNLILKKHQIYEESFSKFCFGLIELKPALKHNNFKEKKHQINKILHA
jgi:hypothetical protein